MPIFDDTPSAAKSRLTAALVQYQAVIDQLQDRVKLIEQKLAECELDQVYLNMDACRDRHYN